MKNPTYDRIPATHTRNDLKRLRETGMTSTQIADQIGCHRTTLHQITTGITISVDPQVAQRIRTLTVKQTQFGPVGTYTVTLTLLEDAGTVREQIRQGVIFSAWKSKVKIVNPFIRADSIGDDQVMVTFTGRQKPRMVSLPPSDGLACGEKCGSDTGYKRHWRAGEKPCPDCLDGVREYDRQRRAAKKVMVAA